MPLADGTVGKLVRLAALRLDARARRPHADLDKIIGLNRGGVW